MNIEKIRVGDYVYTIKDGVARLGSEQIPLLETRVTEIETTISGLETKTNEVVLSNYNHQYESEKHIYDTSSNTRGSWIRFDSGMMICLMEVSASVSVATPWGEIFYGQLSSNVRFPQDFIEVPTLSFGGRQNKSFWTEAIQTTRYETGVINIYRPVADTSDSTYTLGITAIGRWR